MPWNETARKQYIQTTGRYESDVTDAEWALLEPLPPAPSRRGRPRETNLREGANAVPYLLATGGTWRSLPKDFPPVATARNCFYSWFRSGLLNKIVACLRARERQSTGRSAAPTAAIIDSRSVPTVEARSDTRGYDAGKKIKGRKRHLVVDTGGNPLVVTARFPFRWRCMPNGKRWRRSSPTAPTAATNWRRRWRRRTVR